MQMNEQQDAFMRHFFQETYQNPIGNGRVYENMVLLDVSPFNGGIHVHEIRTLVPKREGCGTRALRYLTTMADTFGVVLDLNPVRVGKEGMTNAQLTKWYRKHGFVKQGKYGDHMHRAPNHHPKEK